MINFIYVKLAKPLHVYKTSTMPNFLNHPISIEYKKKFDLAVLEFIIADDCSFETLACKCFIKLCSPLTNKNYKPPHPSMLSCKINDLKKQKYLRICQDVNVSSPLIIGKLQIIATI